MPNNLEQLQKKINYITLRTDSNLDEAVCEALQLIHNELELLRARTAPVGTTPRAESIHSHDDVNDRFPTPRGVTHGA